SSSLASMRLIDRPAFTFSTVRREGVYAFMLEFLYAGQAVCCKVGKQHTDGAPPTLRPKKNRNEELVWRWEDRTHNRVGCCFIPGRAQQKLLHLRPDEPTIRPSR